MFGWQILFKANIVMSCIRYTIYSADAVFVGDSVRPNIKQGLYLLLQTLFVIHVNRITT